MATFAAVNVGDALQRGLDNLIGFLPTVSYTHLTLPTNSRV